MFSEDVITLLESSSYSSASEFKMKLIVSLPNFPIVSKIPPFIISNLLNRLIYASWGQMVLNHWYRAKFDNVISNLCLLMQSGYVDMSKVDVRDFAQWFRNSEIFHICSKGNDFLQLLDKLYADQVV